MICFIFSAGLGLGRGMSSSSRKHQSLPCISGRSWGSVGRVYRFQVRSFSPCSTPLEKSLDGLIKLGVTDVTFGNDANCGSTVSTVYLSSDWVRPNMHFTIDWFVFLWSETINKGVESLHRGHIQVRVGAIRILIYWAYFPFHGTNFWTLPVIHFPANISPFTQRRA